MDLQDYFVNKNVLIALDVSGSMDQSHIPVLQTLQKLSDKSDMFVLPVDAMYHWDKMIKLDMNISPNHFDNIGRGGTLFTEEFLNYNLYMSEPDTILFVTDGWVNPNDFKNFNLKQDVLWIITDQNGFKPPFGQLIDYRNIIRKMMFYSA